MQKKGYATGGFDAYVSTKVIAAAGVSSSASFEMLVCAITNHFFNEGKLEYGEYARAGQYAENVYWKKASGLMDQMACAAGGPILLDFSDKENISCEKIAFSFEDMGCRLVIVNTGKGHADSARNILPFLWRCVKLQMLWCRPSLRVHHGESSCSC